MRRADCYDSSESIRNSHHAGLPMPLNSQQKWKVEDILNQKGINKCPLCGTTPLKVQDKYYNLPLGEAGAAVSKVWRAAQ